MLNWIEFWLARVDLREQIKTDWALIWTKLDGMAPSLRWRHARGPIAGVITSRLESGWEPIEAEVWADPDGKLFGLSDEVSDVSLFKGYFVRSLWARQWQAASLRHVGVGLHRGFDFGLFRKHLRRLWEKGLFLEIGLWLKAPTAGV